MLVLTSFKLRTSVTKEMFEKIEMFSENFYIGQITLIIIQDIKIKTL